jgi:hypothetical protein
VFRRGAQRFFDDIASKTIEINSKGDRDQIQKWSRSFCKMNGTILSNDQDQFGLHSCPVASVESQGRPAENEDARRVVGGEGEQRSRFCSQLYSAPAPARAQRGAQAVGNNKRSSWIGVKAKESPTLLAHPDLPALAALEAGWRRQRRIPTSAYRALRPRLRLSATGWQRSKTS